MKETTLEHGRKGHSLRGLIITCIGLMVGTSPARAAGWIVQSFQEDEPASDRAGPSPLRGNVRWTRKGERDETNDAIFADCRQELNNKQRQVMEGERFWALVSGAKIKFRVDLNRDVIMLISTAVAQPCQATRSPFPLVLNEEDRTKGEVHVTTPSITIFSRGTTPDQEALLEQKLTRLRDTAVDQVRSACVQGHWQVGPTPSAPEPATHRGQRDQGGTERTHNFRISPITLIGKYQDPETIDEVTREIGRAWEILRPGAHRAATKILGPEDQGLWG
jgi:hypothetical protein